MRTKLQGYQHLRGSWKKGVHEGDKTPEKWEEKLGESAVRDAKKNRLF